MFKSIYFAGATVCALALICPIGASATQQTETITAGGSSNPGYAKDATIYQNGGNLSNGAGPGLFAGKNSGGSIRRGLIWFDVVGRDTALSHAIKNATSIDSVTVYMDLGMAAGSGGGDGSGGGTCPGGDGTARTIKLQRVTTGMWGEGTTYSTATQIGGTGGGTAAGAGDATYTEYQYDTTPPPPPSNPWSTTGGDFSGTVSASTSVSNSCPATYTWSGTNMVNDVKAWLGVSGSASNYGWIVIGEECVGAGCNQSFRAFYTKEGEILTLGSGPRLEIKYTP